MFKQAKRVIAGVAAAAVLTGSYSYIAHASDGLYHDSNVSITTAVDKYVAENENAFVIEAPAAKVTASVEMVAATATDATATDAVATGEITEIAPEITGDDIPEATETSAEESSYDFTGKAIVKETGAVNIRESADVNSKRVGYIFNGGVLTVIDRGDEWTHVSSGDIEGYTMTDFLAFDEDAKAYADANMPGTTEFLGAVAVSDDQAEITTPENTDSSDESTEAPAQNLEPVPYSGQGQEIVDYACQFLGNPYVWGGTSLTDGCDCSGFTMRVYEHFGYSIPRAGGQQWCGKEVSLSEIQPGDLLFYDHGTGVSQHVALYMGNGQIVHASDYSTGICISNAYYSQPFKAVRVIY